MVVVKVSGGGGVTMLLWRRSNENREDREGVGGGGRARCGARSPVVQQWYEVGGTVSSLACRWYIKEGENGWSPWYWY